jgi:hypothetical protein
MKVRSFKLGIVVAGLTLASLPALAQDPKGGGGPAAGGGGERSGTGSVASSGGGGGGGGVATGGSGGGSSVSSSGGGGFSSPSSAAASNPSVSVGARGMREAAPSHRASYSENSGARSRTASDDGQKAQPRTASGGSSGGSGERAVPRGSSSSGSSGSSGGNTATASGGRTRPATASGEASGSNNASGAREVPTWSRPRGDRPATGVAVDRTTPIPDRNGNYRGRYGYGGGFYDPYYGYGGYYGSYYGGGYGSPYYYPYGFGLGYGLYSGLGWYPYYGDPYGMDPYYSGYGSYGSYASRDQGNLKLKVKPRSAKVYVDGYFVGYVDQFDGAFQKLPLNGGRHKVEVKADGFETAEFDVLITPDQTVTFQGELKRIQ